MPERVPRKVIVQESGAIKEVPFKDVTTSFEKSFPNIPIEEQIFQLARSEYTPFKKESVSIGPVKLHTIEILKKEGIDVTGYKHEVDNYGLRHALKEHGKDEIPITMEDFKLIPEIIQSPDSINFEGKTKIGTPAIKYAKRHNGFTYYIEEARTGRKTLNLKTMYKTKTPSGASLAPEELGAIRPPQKRVPTPSGVSVNIAQTPLKVNNLPLGIETSPEKEPPFKPSTKPPFAAQTPETTKPPFLFPL